MSLHPEPVSCGSGFTVAEALVAFLIVAIGLQAALSIYASHAEQRREALARQVALGHAEALLAVGIPSANLSAGQAEGDLNGGFRWRLSTSPVIEPTGHGRVMPFHVLVEVWWPSSGGHKSVSLRTVRLSAPPL